MVDTSGSSPFTTNSLTTVTDYAGYTQAQFTSSFSCGEMMQTYIKFEKTNSGIEKFVIRATSDSPVAVYIKIEMFVFVDNRLLLILGISLLSVSAAIALGVIIFCCYKKWKKRREDEEKMNYKQYMFEHIKK